MIFNPQIEGTVVIRSTAPEFLGRFRERITAGLLTVGRLITEVDAEATLSTNE